jgi:hypothetical protein
LSDVGDLEVLDRFTGILDELSSRHMELLESLRQIRVARGLGDLVGDVGSWESAGVAEVDPHRSRSNAPVEATTLPRLAADSVPPRDLPTDGGLAGPETTTPSASDRDSGSMVGLLGMAPGTRGARRRDYDYFAELEDQIRMLATARDPKLEP